MASENEAAVLRAIAGAPYMHNRQIQRATGLKRIDTVNSIIGRLLERKAIVSVGTAADAGLTDAPPRSRLYALAGAAPLTSQPSDPASVSRSTVSGSGQIAGRITHGRGSVWGAGLA